MWWKKYSFLLMYPMAVFGVVGSSYYASGQLNTFDKQNGPPTFRGQLPGPRVVRFLRSRAQQQKRQQPPGPHASVSRASASARAA